MTQSLWMRKTFLSQKLKDMVVQAKKEEAKRVKERLQNKAHRSHPGAETTFEYEQSTNRILQQLEFINPEDLLPENRYLLEVDPTKMALKPADRQQVWQTCMNTAVTVARNRREKHPLPEDSEFEDLQASHF